MLETIRAFIAVNLEVSAVRRVATVQRSLRSSPEVSSASIAWVAPPNLHIALRCLGDIDPALSPAIGDGLREIIGNTPTVRLNLVGLNAFPSVERARIVIIDTKDPTGILEQVAQHTERLVQSIGLQPDRRAFHAHLTLARLREPLDLSLSFASLGEFQPSDAQVTECVLYESSLAGNGAEFRAIDRVGFTVAHPGRSNRPRARHQSHRPKGRSKPPPAAAVSSDAIPPLPKLRPIASTGSKPPGNDKDTPSNADD